MRFCAASPASSISAKPAVNITAAFTPRLARSSIDLRGDFGGDRDDGDVRRFRQIGDRGIGLQPLHLGAVRVDRVQRALKALRLHVGDRPSADAGGIVGGAEHGNGARREKRRETGKSGVGHDGRTFPDDDLRDECDPAVTWRQALRRRHRRQSAARLSLRGAKSTRQSPSRCTTPMGIVRSARDDSKRDSPDALRRHRPGQLLRLSHFLGPTSFFELDFAQPWAKELEARTDGRVKVEIFNGSLGSSARSPNRRHRSADGTIDIALGLRGAEGDRFPRSSIIELPFVVHNALEGSRALWGLYKDGALGDEYSDYKVLALFVHNPGLIHTASKRVVAPDDLKELAAARAEQDRRGSIAGDWRDAGDPAGERRHAGSKGSHHRRHRYQLGQPTARLQRHHEAPHRDRVLHIGVLRGDEPAEVRRPARQMSVPRSTSCQTSAWSHASACCGTSGTGRCVKARQARP